MKKHSVIHVYILMILSGLFWYLPLHADQTDADVKIENAYVPQLPPSVKNRSAYFAITNLGNRKRTITGVHATGFKMAHLHQTEVRDGITSMKSVQALELESGETLVLEPGGLHIMLMNPEEISVSNGDVPITLTFANGDAVSFVALVQATN